MAFEDDFRNFMENRLQAFDPTIDLSPNSSAQTKIIDAALARLGEDPFSVDIGLFLRDRLTQEFPELAADGGGLLEDLITKPLQLLFEPFKREVELTRINQSVRNADVLSDEEADALAANFFQEREEGDFAGDIVRLFFAAPTTVRVTTDRQLTSRGGLAFFPVENSFITSQQMLFNRDGDLFFMDIAVRAEAPGSAYNVDAGEIISIDDVEGVVRVANLSDFRTGLDRQTNEDFLGSIPQALTERSLVTKRGITTRTPDVFTGVRALQVIGAGEDGMDRDILEGTGEGFLHLVGNCAFYLNWVIVTEVLYLDDGPDDDITVQVGDKIRLQLSVAEDPSRVAHEAAIRDIISTGVGTADEKHIFVLDKTLDTLVGSTGSGVVSVFKAGFITISGLPGGIAQEITVPEGSVHLGGHTDILIRPSANEEREGVLPNATGDSPLLALLDVSVAADNNTITSFTDFVASGVQPGDVAVIETGEAAGSYRILSVGSPDADTVLRVDSVFSTSEANLRARITQELSIDLVEPKIPKIPFQAGPVADLSTTVGSALFRLTTTNLQVFGAVVGDTIRVLDGPNAGDYLIESFDAVLGGLGPIVDRPAPATSTGQRFEVFTANQGLEFPLVRIRSLEILDSANQGTGISIPYGDAVDVRPLCTLEGAGHQIRVLDKQLIVFPDASGLWGTDGSSLPQTFANPSSSTDDARYTQGIAVADGRVRTATSDAANPITTTEINFPPFLFNGRRDTVMAFTTREDSEFNLAGGPHRTSDIAEAEVGDSLVILDGPNVGSYTIQDLRVLDMWLKDGDGHRRIALVQLDRELPLDPLGTAIEYIADVGAVAAVTAGDLAEMIEDATIFFDSNFWSTTIIGKLVSTINSQGFTVTADEVEDLLRGLATSGYEIGPSATGTLRAFFQEPVTVELFFGADPTLFRAVNDPSLEYRLSPELPPAQIFPEAEEETPATQWNRDLVLKEDATTFAFLVEGSSFAQRGIRDGDVIEYHVALNDLPARGKMTSSWMFVTFAGSNEVRAIYPGGAGSDLPDNSQDIEAGHLLFIDSGPDAGAYVITQVIDVDMAADPPVARFRVDRALTHTTNEYPGATDRDFVSQVMGFLKTTGNDLTAPGMALDGLTLSVTFDSQDGSPDTRVHIFGTGSGGGGEFVSAAEIAADINGDAAFVGTDFEAITDGDEVVLRTLLNSAPRETIQVNGVSTCLGTLAFPSDSPDGGRLGAVAIEGSKRIYGTGLTGFLADQTVTLYAANSSTILADGDDEAYLGTYTVVAAGTQTGGPLDGQFFVELDRAEDFPARAEVRWLRHEAPETSPSDTSGGGKELSTNYIRGRTYAEVPERSSISIPWTTFTGDNPLLSTSEEQIELAVDPINGAVNFSHKMPYRIVREGVLRISSTSMALNRDGALYFVDLPVSGVGVREELNISEDVGLTIEGRASISGYVFDVDNPIFTFSTEEQVKLVLPISVLPAGSTPDLDNEIRLAGQNLQVNYDSAPLVASIQQFFNSPLDRVVVANALVRHFLPSYVYVDATYIGGGNVDDVAQDLIDYINNIDPNSNELATDAITNLIKQRGSSRVVQPITLIALTHGTDRRIRGAQSDNVLGGDSLPTFSGNFKQTYFIAGPNTSSDDVRPTGEQVFLVRL